MASAKLYLLHLQEITKRALEEEKRQTKLLVVLIGLVILNMVVQVMLLRS